MDAENPDPTPVFPPRIKSDVHDSVERAFSTDAVDFSIEEVEKFVERILEAPKEDLDTRVVALVRGAVKMQRRFAPLVTLRALRLETALRDAQQRIIRLQWEVVQLRRFERAYQHATDGDED
jgi:hypothetical protein